MKTNTQIIKLVTTIIMLLPTLAAALEIREEIYAFQMESTRNPPCSTFVLRNRPHMSKTPSINYRSLMIHFELGSADLSPTAASSILSSMKAQSISPNTPLIITGYSCELGTTHSNRTLSLQRAMTVANFLSNQGFTITALQARGEEDPITNDPRNFSENRRVEITTQSSHEMLSTIKASSNHSF